MAAENGTKRENRIFGSLMEPPAVAGAPKQLAVMNGTITAVFVMRLNFWWFIPIGLGVHIFARYLMSKDPYIFDVYQRYRKQGDHYDPWPRRVLHTSKRPEGAGREVLC